MLDSLVSSWGTYIPRVRPGHCFFGRRFAVAVDIHPVKSTSGPRQLLHVPSRMEIQDDTDRIDNLNFAINCEYANREPAFVESMAAYYGESIMEMFEVVEVRKDSIVLTHHFEDRIFEPVWLPKEIIEHLEADDLFLMTLGKADDQWLVLWMSPAYESWNWLEDECEVEGSTLH